MKFLIAIFLVSSASVGLFFGFQNEELQRDCSCQSYICSCSVSCGDGTPQCSCGSSCSCGCHSQSNEDGHYQTLPTANETQNENSVAAQRYFEGLGTGTGTVIAGYFEILRNAIANKDLETYKKNAPLLEEAFKKLTKSEQNAYEEWLVENLKLVKK